MKKLLYVLMLVASFAFSQAIQANITVDNAKLEEVVLTVPFEALIISREGIAVNFQGDLLAVHALCKNGEQWTIRAGGYYECHNGHTRACPQCGGCAVPDCLYYCDGYCCHRGS